ncbi:Ankyrin repeat and KH domain-containing protein mask [Gryllus bimaculatus]|nr:Ankyrin repeat and KH domain-containing protein mask [Gryllus bimaculatus]
MKPSRKSFEDLIHFCKMKEESTVLQLLDEGVFINDSDENGITPLHVASAVGAQNIVKVLVLKGADIDKSTNLGWTPIMYSARNGHSKCIQQLIALGANVHHVNKFGVSVFSMATASGNKEIIEILLQEEQKELLSENVISPLHITALLGHFHTLSSLLGSQIHLINKSDKHGITPLMLAVAGGHEEVIKILLDFGADTNLYNSHHCTALDIASTKRFKKIVHLLADKTKEGKNVHSPEVGSDLIEQYGWSSVCTPKPRSYTWHSGTPKENMFNFPTSEITPRNPNIASQENEDRSLLFTPVYLPLKDFPQVSVNTNLETNVCAQTNATCVPVPPVSPYNCSSSPFHFPKTVTPKKHHSLGSLNHHYSYHERQRLKYSTREEKSSLQESNGKLQGISGYGILFDVA